MSNVTPTRPRRPHARHARGFTLTELLVVMAIMGVATALAVPSLIRTTQRHGLRQETRELQHILSMARSRAVASRRYVAVEFDLQTYPTPDGVRVLDNAQWNAVTLAWEGTDMDGVDAHLIAHPMDVQTLKIGTTSYYGGVHAIVFAPTGAAAMDDGSIIGPLDIGIVHMQAAASL